MVRHEMPAADSPDPLQGHTREWPSTPYSDEARAPDPPLEEACSIALFGDCTVSASLWPKANRPENHLAVRLRRAFPDQPFIVQSFADQGGSARDFIRSGQLARVLETLRKLDIAFVRYGINDRKREGISGCIESLGTLCQSIERSYQGVKIIIETGICVDYPAHYLWDRNSALAPLYEAMRRFALERGYAVVDIFKNTEIETRNGNWDLRVRGLPDESHIVVDDSFDEFFGDDVAFFSNIHPNSRCMGLIADWEVMKLKEVFGARLPGIHADARQGNK
jgi:acyl-CoA thioesterase-1